MNRLSVLVITKNEAERVDACLNSVRGIADELIVVDSGSTDATTAIAGRYTDRVYFNKFENFATQRNFALSKATGDWVLFIDADETCTPELASEISQLLEATLNDAAPVAYGIPRWNCMFGRWMRHAGWYPDYQYRLFRRDKGAYDESRLVHELVNFEGQVATVQGHLIHYNYDSLSEFCAKQLAYAKLEARSRAEAGVTAKYRNFVLQPLREFHRRFVKLEGRREGALGFLLSALLAYYDLIVYVELKRLNARQRP